MRNVAFVWMLLVASASLPSQAGEMAFGIGLGLNTGITTTQDSEETSFGTGDQETTTGFSLLAKFEINKAWGLSATYRQLDGEDDGLGEQQYTQIGIHAIRTWRTGKLVRPHFKFGFVQTELEYSSPFGSASQDGFGPSLGGGIEVGSKLVSFLAELDSTAVELGGEVRGVASWTAGVIFKF